MKTNNYLKIVSPPRANPDGTGRTTVDVKFVFFDERDKDAVSSALSDAHAKKGARGDVVAWREHDHLQGKVDGFVGKMPFRAMGVNLGGNGVMS